MITHCFEIKKLSNLNLMHHLRLNYLKAYTIKLLKKDLIKKSIRGLKTRLLRR